MGTEYVVYQSKWKQFGLSLVGVLMTLAGLFVLVGGLTERQYVDALVGLVGLLFFGFCTVVIIRQLFVGKQLVVLTDEGFFDYTSATATRDLLIPWDQIEKIENKSLAGQTFVSIYLRDPEELFSGLSTFQKKAIAANKRMGFGDININLQNAKQCTDAQLIVRMDAYLADRS